MGWTRRDTGDHAAGGPDVTVLDKLRNRTARVRQHRWRMRAYRSDEAHIVIGGSPRSGTTLLRRTLDRHPSICCGPEMALFLPVRFQLEPLAALSGIDAPTLGEMIRSSASQGAMVDAFSVRFRAVQQKDRWAEKTPRNVRHLAWIAERFPEARLVHVIRDGRDVVCSAREHPDRHWVNGRWVWVHHPRPIERYAHDWVRDTEHGLRFRGYSRYHELRYEDLVGRPEETLRTLCDFVGVTFNPKLLAADPDARTPGFASTADAGRPTSMVTAAGRPTSTSLSGVEVPVTTNSQRAPHLGRDRGPVFTTSLGRWRRDLTESEQAAVSAICGPQLRLLGYMD